MTITCTANEKERLLRLFVRSHVCEFTWACPKPEPDCKECCEKNITWVVVDEESGVKE